MKLAHATLGRLDILDYLPCDDLWVITTHFNPCHYRSRVENYRIFAESLRLSGIHLVTIECAFGDDPFELPLTPGDIQVRARDVLWQKERLLNVAVAHLPVGVLKVAWIDSDILFLRPDWAPSISRMLDECPVLQPFSVRRHLYPRIGRLHPRSLDIESFSWNVNRDPVCLQPGIFARHGHTGYAWAGRRDWLERLGLYDAMLAGNGDHYMAHAFAGDLSSKCIDRNFTASAGENMATSLRKKVWWRRLSRLIPAGVKTSIRGISSFDQFKRPFHRHFMTWAQALHSTIDGRLGCLEGEILHLWHGASEDRTYAADQQQLLCLDFDPTLDVQLGLSGCWEWARERSDLSGWARRIFDRRREDDAPA